MKTFRRIGGRPPIAARAARITLFALSGNLALEAQTPDVTAAQLLPVGREQPAPPRVPPLEGLDLSRLIAPPVLFDKPGDGAIWVRGETYKASFDAAGATYIPYLGSHAPRNFPVRFTVNAVSAGGRTLALAEAVAPRRDGDRIVYDRGTVEERYECGPEGIEQVFVVGSEPGGGDLVVRMEVETDLACEGVGEQGLVFSAEGLGAVRYGRAIAFDGQGARVDAPLRWDGWEIELRVPAAFVAAASGPITIDPLISSFCVACTPFVDNLNPDASYDETSDRFMVVYEAVFSATDHDVRSIELDSTGAFIPGSVADIDTTSVSWFRPRIANNNAANRHLVVANTIGPVSFPGETGVGGRLRNAGSTSMLPQFTIESNTAFLLAGAPDVGGDPSAVGATLFCVAYPSGYSGTLTIEIRTFDSSGALSTGGVIGSASALITPSGSAAVSKSNGATEWTIAWSNSVSDLVFAGRVASNGSFLSGGVLVSGSLTADDIEPTVSSPDAQGRVLVAWTRLLATGDVVLARVLQGLTPLTPATDLASLAGVTPSSLDRGAPSADSDGCGFTVVFREGDPSVGVTELYAATFHYSPDGSIGLTEGSLAVPGGGPYTEFLPQIVSKASGGGIGPRHLIVWHRDDGGAIGVDHDILGGIFDSLASPCVPSGVPCPLFAENFEGAGLGAYTETGGSPAGSTLWHGETYCLFLSPPSFSVPVPASFGTKAAAYNRGDLGFYNYSTGAANSGSIESPVIPSTAGASLFVTFDFLRETELGGGFDQSFVEARPAGGAWVVASQILQQRMCTSPVHVSVPVPVAGGNWQHRFRFDTVDAAGNGYRGWYVDNVEAVQVASSGGSFTTNPTGCGGPVLTPTGLPVIGGTVTYTLSGTTGIPVIWLGPPTSVPLCPPAPCALGAAPGVLVPGTTLSGAIPCQPTLMGSVFSVQGGDIGAAGGCGPAAIGIPFAVTHAIDTTIG